MNLNHVGILFRYPPTNHCAVAERIGYDKNKYLTNVMQYIWGNIDIGGTTDMIHFQLMSASRSIKKNTERFKRQVENWQAR